MKSTRLNKQPTLAERVFDARPDTLDFRDLMYTPTLVEVPTERPLSAFRKHRVPVLDQGREGACTGFGLATVVHYLLRARRVRPDADAVSPQMLYDLARRYDEWPGEDYEGSSCRGAMKGWHKHGVCGAAAWPTVGRTALSARVVGDAAGRPLGAYFRVNHRDLVAMHAAIAEAGVLYVSAGVHAGWDAVAANGRIALADDNLGAHAFALVGYDAAGFWLQNSWGTRWGRQGFGHIGYDDWLRNGSDAWVARLAVPVRLGAQPSARSVAFSPTQRAKAYAYAELRPHVVSLGNQGRLNPHGNIGTTPELLREIVQGDLARTTRNWKKKRIVLYAHGGLVGEDAALQRVADYRRAMLDAECYPLAFVWHTDAWNTLKNILQDATNRRRPEGFLDASKDFMLDRLDDALEPLARVLGGRALWREMKENALAATVSPDGGARQLLNELAQWAAAEPQCEFHVIGHSAGSILLAPLVQVLASAGVIGSGPMAGQHGLGLKLASAALWAPAITTQLFKHSWLPVLQAGATRLALFTLDDKAERDDHCASIYHKSLLYLVSHALEDHARVPLLRPTGEPLLGLERCLRADPVLRKLFGSDGPAQWVLGPNAVPAGGHAACGAKHHGDFDDDRPTVLATLAHVLGRTQAQATLRFQGTAQGNREARRRIDAMPDFAMTR